jgi:hypothetical protein
LLDDQRNLVIQAAIKSWPEIGSRCEIRLSEVLQLPNQFGMAQPLGATIYVGVLNLAGTTFKR